MLSDQAATEHTNTDEMTTENTNDEKSVKEETANEQLNTTESTPEQTTKEGETTEKTTTAEGKSSLFNTPTFFHLYISRQHYQSAYIYASICSSEN
ncbi:unnamed protein product [Schistosoma curassoni]|uniref:CTNNB1 binding N-teminal domain-containing protein n=1 Tax=Schistosoma curassoni TaxID=6186 RepID=A0A183K454_9TREM|nr:unnamed protein product [Schistosoma curassoni]